MSKQSLQSKSSVPVPRNFILLDCIERAGQYPNVTYGISFDDTNPNNSVNLEDWNGTIIFDDGENLNIVDVKIKCTEKFPYEVPIVTFPQYWLENKSIKKICNSDGTLNKNTMEQLNKIWNDKLGIGDYLVNLGKKITY